MTFMTLSQIQGALHPDSGQSARKVLKSGHSGHFLRNSHLGGSELLRDGKVTKKGHYCHFPEIQGALHPDF